MTRAPAARELAADRVVHVVGIGLGLAGTIFIILVAAIEGGARDLVPIVVYAAGLLAMLGCSAAYNVFHASGRREWLRRFDHAAIFAMIAGTYTPFTTRLGNGWASSLTAVIWIIAGLGIALKLWQPRRIETMSIVLYLALGWIGLAAVEPFLAALDPSTLVLLALGGIIYTAGVIFHLWHRLPYQNAIWHGFVLVAASVHYAAVLGLVVDA
ncbi:MAG: hemolysin III family protein [Reyranella sp.]|nr:hemolysin III family protein [Reyranella sp.]